MYGEERNTFRVLVEEPEGERGHLKVWAQWGDSIKTGLIQNRIRGCGLTDLAQDCDTGQATMNMVVKLRVP
jgi:hypothetical protein